MTVYDEPGVCEQALHAGRAAYFRKRDPGEKIVAAIRQIAHQPPDRHVGPTLFSLAALMLSIALLGGCSSDRYLSVLRLRPSTTGEDQPPDSVSYWSDAATHGKARIVIDLDAQRAYFYRNDQLVGLSIVSTGREGFDTPSGQFKVIEKDQNHASSMYGDFVDQNGTVVLENVDSTKDKPPPGTTFRGAPMPYFLRIKGGIGMHAGYLPGYPASHGCIRLPPEMATRFFENAKVGTPVAIRSNSALDGQPDEDDPDLVRTVPAGQVNSDR